MCIGRTKLNSSDIAKVKRSKVNVTRLKENSAQKPQTYAAYTSLDSRPIEIYPSYKKSRSPEQMAGSDFRPEAPK